MSTDYAKIECPASAYQVLATEFRGRGHFHLQTKAELLTLYVIFATEFDVDIVTRFAKRNPIRSERIIYDAMKSLQVNTADYKLDGDGTLANGILVA